ncbi:hypothetical protein TanjilG_04535 [Lupinus angustifolius]|uniref:Serine incorporator n=1 Tax=Lupinus angustifolius TaxID=3871 RepID=A0A4P1RQU0_LUPAN|nr:hypothetical protein TanjilG_04535 [Lupinus angustifolius]
MVNVESNTERCTTTITNTISEDSPWYSQFRNASNPWMARYVYGLIFLVANLLAWASRDELSSLSALLEMKGFRGCKVGKDCLGTEGVLRVSMGCFRILPSNTSHKSYLAQWQVSHFGAGVFLLIQLISIISFITWLNDRWVSEKYAERCQIHVVIFATIAYCVCLTGIILMYFWYAPQPTCLLNLFFITWTLLLLQIITSVSLHSKVNAGILSPGLMGLYVVYLCCEPAGARCIVKSDSATTTDWQSIISFVVAILAIVIATFSTGIDSKCFQFRKDDTPAEDDVPYGYGFFHLVFATGAMYFAMILIGWNSHHSMRKYVPYYHVLFLLL